MCLTGWLLSWGQAAAEPAIETDQVIENPDASRTFVQPRVWGGDGYLRIRRGVPGSCRLLGMSGFLSKYVVWSNRPVDAVEVREDGSVGEKRHGLYIKAITCTDGEPYLPSLTADSIDKHTDGSATIRAPRIQTGPEVLPITSGQAGACRLLGYQQAVQHSLSWSTQRSAGVSLALDGQIYERARGTYVTEMRCKNEIDK